MIKQTKKGYLCEIQTYKNKFLNPSVNAGKKRCMEKATLPV